MNTQYLTDALNSVTTDTIIKRFLLSLLFCSALFCSALLIFSNAQVPQIQATEEKSQETYTVELPDSFNFQAHEASTLSMSSMGTTLDKIECTWDFGDGSPTATTTFKNMGMIEHTYEENGTFTVQLTCVNETEEVATDTSIVYVGREASEEAYQQQQNPDTQGATNIENLEESQTASENDPFSQETNLETFFTSKTIIIIGTFIFIVVAGITPIFILIRKGKI